MSPILATAALLLAFSVLLALPLAPACLELLSKADSAPLNVIQQHAGDVRFFADGFRNYLETIRPAVEESLASHTNLSVVMPDGDNCLILGDSGSASFVDQNAPHTCTSVIVSTADLRLPPSTAFAKDIYSRGDFMGGENDQYRAILGERSVRLGSRSTVMRWVHGVGEVIADTDCRLYGRISSESCIRLHPGTSFSRLNAPRIELGACGAVPPPVDESLEQVDLHPLTRLLQDGDFELAEGETFRGHLVVRGNLKIGSGARVFGSVKGLKEVALADGAFVAGSLISSNVLRIGKACSIHGPVIAERAAYLDAGSRCGSPQVPTTVSAPRIEVAVGATVFGTLWARDTGKVVINL